MRVVLKPAGGLVGSIWDVAKAAKFAAALLAWPCWMVSQRAGDCRRDDGSEETDTIEATGWLMRIYGWVGGEGWRART